MLITKQDVLKATTRCSGIEFHSHLYSTGFSRYQEIGVISEESDRKSPSTVSYDAATGIAEIEIIDGFIEPGMTIEIRGETERFDQQVQNIMKDGQSVKRALKGDVVLINVKQAVTPACWLF